MQIFIFTIIKEYKCISSNALKLPNFSHFNKLKIKFIKDLYTSCRKFHSLDAVGR